MERSFLVRVLAVTTLLTATCVAALAIEPGLSDGGSPRKTRVALVKQKTPKKKKGVRKPVPKAEAPEPTTPAAGSEPLKFSRDVAPILVANCVGCHNGSQKRTKLELTTFEKMMAGTPDHKVIVGGNLEESHLVLRIKGEETPKMPQGANRNLSDAAIAKIEAWVKAGAILDAGIDPKASMEKYAASPEDLRKAELAKLPADQRDKRVEASGLERWKKASKAKPEVTSSSHFLMFSTLSKDRAAGASKAVEAQYAQVRALLGPKSVEWGEKATLFVLPNAQTYVEFVRALESRDIEEGDVGTARMTIPQPYVAVIDPLHGRDEPAASPTPKKAGRGKKGDDSASSGETSLAALLSENFVIGTAEKAGKPPRWVSLGLGAFMASRSEPRSASVNAIRSVAHGLFQRGWPSKATEALGDQAKTQEVRAVGFAIFEWMNTADRRVVPAFVQGMLEGGDKLDDVLGNVLNMSREQFLTITGEFVGTTYGRLR